MKKISDKNFKKTIFLGILLTLFLIIIPLASAGTITKRDISYDETGDITCGRYGEVCTGIEVFVPYSEDGWYANSAGCDKCFGAYKFTRALCLSTDGGDSPPPPPSPDTTPPVTTAAAEQLKEDGAFFYSYSLVEPVSFTKRDVNITLICSDTSGCARIEYCIDKANECIPSTLYTKPVTKVLKDTKPVTILNSNEGINYIRYNGTDTKGNVESPKSSTIKIDSTAPTTTAYATSPPGGSEYISEAPATQDSVKIELSCDDGAGDVSGCVGIGEYSAYKDRGIFYCTDKNCNCEPIEGSRYTDPVIISESDGISCIRYRSVDKAFNYEAPRKRVINIVSAGSTNQPPTATLSANPSEGESPLTVTFTGGCSDPEDKLLACVIDYGDSSGGLFETGKTNTYSYSSEDYTATLTASDTEGLIGIDDVKITVNQEIVVPEPTPTYCNDYTTSDDCAADAYHVADDSTPSGFTETCGIVTWQGYSSSGSRIDLNPPCNDTTDCMCEWTEGAAVPCDFSVTIIKESRQQCFPSGIPSGTTGSDKCKFTTTKEEYNATTGIKTINVSAEWISPDGHAAPDWCKDKLSKIRVALLPFFTITNLVIVVAILIIIYFLISYKKKSRKSKKITKTNKKVKKKK